MAVILGINERNLQWIRISEKLIMMLHVYLTRWRAITYLRFKKWKAWKVAILLAVTADPKIPQHESMFMLRLIWENYYITYYDWF